MGNLVQPLFAGELDIVGDVHGEMDALRSLLTHLGYTHEGREHPQGRRLVFVGDLCDRGPDSPAVVELACALVRAGVAQAITGNHELNLLRGEAKHGNRWFTEPAHRENTDEFSCKTATPQQREEFPAFWRTLPLALERADLRIVHACWDAASIAALRESHDDNIATFAYFERKVRVAPDLAKLVGPKEDALAPHRHGRSNQHYEMPALPAVGEHDALKQRLHPVRCVTSGLEHPSDPFWAKGEWRFCQRTRWWDGYTDAVPVVFGHYWRTTSFDKDINDGNPPVFDDFDPRTWLGPSGNLYCIDFAVGDRYRQRRVGSNGTVSSFTGRLAALSWPSRRVTFDDGTIVEAAT